MKRPALDGMLLASADPRRLATWYESALDPTETADVDDYRVLKYGSVHLIIDTRSDISDKNPEPGRMILNFDVEDARAVVTRMESAGTTWVAELEDRDGSLFATALDPDGNYVQIIQLSDEHRAAM
ncbi:VOC family protein [Nonomuraea sp. SBT364]|uniref:VOC family protein n=1 Tax=Nonomuraea sp. SBT364 TaxID=1580530 RepID=UPI00066EF5D3|nr:VOC family protein [Nonomuraea sp. SBT364]